MYSPPRVSCPSGRGTEELCHWHSCLSVFAVSNKRHAYLGSPVHLRRRDGQRLPGQAQSTCSEQIILTLTWANQSTCSGQWTKIWVTQSSISCCLLACSASESKCSWSANMVGAKSKSTSYKKEPTVGLYRDTGPPVLWLYNSWILRLDSGTVRCANSPVGKDRG